MIGMGHVQQSTTFASELRSVAEILFLTTSDETVAQSIRRAGFAVKRLASDADVFVEVTSHDVDVVIFDKIDVSVELVRDIRNRSKTKIVIFTNLTDANRYAHVAVTADIGSRFENVSFTDPVTGTLYYYGPKYWVLRPEFREYHRKNKSLRNTIERVLLIFGGSDPAALTPLVLDELLREPKTFVVDVVVGAHFSHDAQLTRVLEQHADTRDRVAVHRNIRNVGEMMFNADLTIASPGLSAFESLCVGTPVIVMPQTPLQRDTYHGFMRMVDGADVGQLPSMIARREFTYPSEPHIARMQIGEGVSELVDIIVALAQREDDEMD
jgi:spore coat polysaccharide biosynthesis predicted glycosyltransferase SpsG